MNQKKGSVGTFLILSGQYVKGDLAQIFGRIPPSMLPAGGRKLYEHQIESSPRDFRKIITVPADYKLSARDKSYFKSNEVSVIHTPPSTLEASLLKLLTIYLKDVIHSPLEILYGDTLLPKLDTDSVAVINAPSFYEWGRLESLGEQCEIKVFAGRLRIENPSVLVNKLSTGIDLTRTLDELIIEKHLHDFFSINWLDFGNMKTYIDSRKSFFETRSFNCIEIEGNKITKSSDSNPLKIQRESEWLQNVPMSLRCYFPSLLAVSNTSYTIPFIPEPSLHEIFVFGQLSVQHWTQIFKAVSEYFSDCIKAVPNNMDQTKLIFQSESLLFEKTLIRLESYPKYLIGDEHNFGMCQIDSLKNIIREFRSDYSPDPITCFQHGDAVISNIFWDYRIGSIKLIDPRAMNNEGELHVFGDLRYDLAKLFQSIFLGYSLVLADSFNYEESIIKCVEGHFNGLETYRKVIEEFDKTLCAPYGVDILEIAQMALILMIGLIPLHSDRPDRQRKFIEIVKSESLWKEHVRQ